MQLKVLLVLAVILPMIISFGSQDAQTQERENVAAKQKATNLEVLLNADKHRYKRSDDITLAVKLRNTHGAKDIFVYGTLEFGYRASFTLYRRDARGKEVPTRFIDDAWELPPKAKDTTAFVKLLPDHFLGTYYRSSIRTLNLLRPGSYTMWVEYHSPIAATDVDVSPFWGSENGIIKSNLVSVEVVP
jgi:hypothetical protein